jgi:hypothetical protein
VNGYLLRGDARWHDDNALMAELSQLNTQVARYIMRYLDADAGRAEPISAGDEQALGLMLTELGDALQRRAAQRESQSTNSRQVIDGTANQPWALEPSRESDMDNGP